ILGRAPEAGAVDTWTLAMQRGADAQQVLAGFLASPELFQKSGATTQGWLNAAYADVFGRAPDTNGFLFWANQLNTGAATRDQVANALVTSQEKDNLIVGQAYHDLLGRSPDAGGAAHWSGALAHGMTPEQMYNNMVASREFGDQQDGADLPTQ